MGDLSDSASSQKKHLTTIANSRGSLCADLDHLILPELIPFELGMLQERLERIRHLVPNTLPLFLSYHVVCQPLHTGQKRHEFDLGVQAVYLVVR